MRDSRKIIFVGGVHGVGKTYFTYRLSAALGIQNFSASDLLRKYKQTAVDQNKRVADINANQDDLLLAVEMFTPVDETFILDGHFCLLDLQGHIQQISISVFEQLRPSALILLHDDPILISEKLLRRDGRRLSAAFIESFQDKEQQAARQVSCHLNTPLFITKPELSQPILDYIRSTLA